MNQKFTLAAIAMFAVIMGIGMVAPAMAAPNERAGNDNPRANAAKEYICHVEEDDPETEEDESSIDLIRVPTHSAHFDANKHPLDFAPFEVVDDAGTPDDDSDDTTTLSCVDPDASEPPTDPTTDPTTEGGA